MKTISVQLAIILTAAVAAVSPMLIANGAGPAGGAPNNAGGGRRGAGAGGGAPAPVEAAVVLPKTVATDGKPQINGAMVTGAGVKHWFMFKVAATGDGPLAYSADNLPEGLKIDGATGIITGAMEKAQATAVTLHVKNAKGDATRPLVIVVGEHKLALTPQLGFNSWNAYGMNVNADRMKAAADGMVKSGLIDHGFTYINLDDGWAVNVPRAPRGGGAAPAMPTTRSAEQEILPNNKFPSIKDLADYVHAKGLKFGIYSSPGPTTCGGAAASYGHEDQDAKTWASWGVDYIKYDWCSYGNVPGRPQGLDGAKAPYKVLRAALDKVDRDIVYSLCQYGDNAVWNWGDEDDIKGNSWRVTGDISTAANQVWQSMSNIGFQQSAHAQFAGPGHWNDTDMLIVGNIGLSSGGNVRPTGLTQNEQLTHIGLWSLLAAPMLLGCDLNRLDEFTTNLMSNDEVLAVNQDPLGKQAWRIAALNADDSPAGAAAAPAGGGRRGGGGGGTNAAAKQIWARPLLDGTYAVGLFNLGNDPATVKISLKDLGDGLKTTLNGPLPVRDLWQLKDLAAANDAISAEVPRHGCVLLKIGKAKPQAECVAEIVKMNAPK